MAYLGNTPQTVTRTDFVYLATAGQTVFTAVDMNGLVLSYDVNNFDVFANGVLLNKQDYTAATGSSITLNTARYVNDIITIRAYGVLSTINALLPAKTSIQTNTTFGYRNKLINGNFDIWQRGTSQTAAGYFSADRWNNSHVGSSKTVSRQAFSVGQNVVSGNPTFFMRTVVTSVTGSTNYVVASQRIEDVTLFSGSQLTVTFWAKADANRNIATEHYQSFGTGGSPSADVTGISPQTFALTTSWQKFSYVINVPSVSGKTLGTNNDDYFQLMFWFDGGSSFNSRNNSLGQQSGTFDIARVSIVDGDATGENDPFSFRHYQQELALCQRYYEQGFGYLGGYGDVAGRNCYVWINFAVQKRTVPALTYSVGSNTNCTIYDARNPAVYGLNWFCTTTAAGGFSWNGSWFADAEI